VLETSGAKAVVWELDEEDSYRFDEERLKSLVTPRTRLIDVCNPHNPTGRVLTKQELRAIADIAVDHRIRIISDELWEDIIFDGRKHVSIASLGSEVSDLTLTSWGFSKTFGVAGLQLGYMCTTDKTALAEMKRQASGIQRGSSTLARAIAPIMLDGTLDRWRRDMMTHLTRMRDLCAERINSIPDVNFPILEGTYVPFPRFNVGMKSKELTDYLLNVGKVGLSSGISFGPSGEWHQRMCIATSEAIMVDALERIERAIGRLGR
jgi:aspartate/methionine/tyrosine aminotransferase